MDKHLTRNEKKLKKLMEAAHNEALGIYIDEARRVLCRCATLSHLVAAMGSAFWVDRDGDIIHEESDLPAIARHFMMNMEDTYYSYFRSPGIKIYRDRIITDW
ncbi:hypothetical protein G6L26_009550 [Agrobacterium radiobacter]|uniref:hypothetical protein n=1 Tax=Agrobacterium tumefaciens complex TaxID=1183400 RepID=UPI00080FB06D|nr:hypothetical protein [Agrobacterium tumefaciens]NTA05429.1 hypothetical protein [Agrobacterium tumefaciens]NTA92022.1 hypothetical protein [Agrobacterium tumefaciens]OCJ32184.1 hypothetical protein A6U90_09715 [Agrobacterium tumefaciens]